MKKKRICWTGIMVLMILSLSIVIFSHKKRADVRKITYRINTESVSFTESARMLNNPNRGFYFLHGFIIEDTEIDFRREFASRYCYDTETTLTLVEINLLRYRDREISEQGLANIENLFTCFQNVNKKMILRFLYDWDGKNLETEPDSREIILTHMRQLEPVLRRYQDQIFLIQGLFVGDIGEMHNSRFLSDEDVRILARQLADVTDEKTFLSVRTPVFWRKITGLSTPEQTAREDGTLTSRLGLYNDGMLGSESDYGTYGTGTLEENGPFIQWNRADELTFQNTLCRLVPIGGEVIVDNPYNDLENAIRDMSVMHVTYLNRAYDGNVMEKWQNTPVAETGCFNGMDGLTYMERHLGYRLVIRDTDLTWNTRTEQLSVDVTIQNVGFAPVYKETEVRMILCREDGSELYSRAVPQDIRELAGGTQAAQLLTIHTDFSLTGLPDGTWQIYFETFDTETGQRILYGNEQEAESYGYRIGSIEKITENSN